MPVFRNTKQPDGLGHHAFFATKLPLRIAALTGDALRPDYELPNSGVDDK